MTICHIVNGKIDWYNFKLVLLKQKKIQFLPKNFEKSVRKLSSPGVLLFFILESASPNSLIVISPSNRIAFFSSKVSMEQ